MKPQLNNNIQSSFLFWAENELITHGDAYKNYTSKLYYNEDLRLDTHQYVTYGAPFKQWIYNAGITGAYICSGISGSITLADNQSGLKIDYDNGRVILPASFGTGLNISGSYSFKEINFYLSNETEEYLLTDAKYYLNPRLSNQFPTGSLKPYYFYNPAIYIVLANNDNIPLALGGIKETEVNLSMVVQVETMYQLDAIMSIFTDTKEKYIPQISIYDDPINEFGDVKTGLYPNGFNYSQLVADKGQPGNLLYIKDVKASKISDRIKLNTNIFAGIIDFTISKIRISNSQ